jgi:hypothetical protein
LSTDDGEELTGGCACGAVRYRLASRPIWVHCCHCTDCQRETGSGFAVNALIEADRVELTAGRPAPILTPSASGRGQTIWRCAACQVALWSNYGGNGAIHFVRAGTLDRPERITPDIHIYTASKLPWLAIPAGARAVPRFYDYEDTWPAEAWERRQVALAGDRTLVADAMARAAEPR